MKALITRFFALDAQNVIPYVYVAIGVVWVVMVVTTLFSIAGQELGRGVKVSWTLAVVFVPIVGMAAYCFRCLFTAEYPLLQQLGFSSSGAAVSGGRKNIGEVPRKNAI